MLCHMLKHGIHGQFVLILGFSMVRSFYQLLLSHACRAQALISNRNSLELAGLLIEFTCLCQEYLCLLRSSVLLHMLSYMLKEHGGFLQATYRLP